MRILARVGLGAVAGVAATVFMDRVTEAVYTEYIKKRESKIARRSAASAVAKKLLTALELHPTEEDAQRLAPMLHWAIGIGTGMLAGAAAGKRNAFPFIGLGAALGMLSFDELGLAALGATPPSSKYPWQTSARSVLGHAAYAVALAIAYDTLAELAKERP